MVHEPGAVYGAQHRRGAPMPSEQSLGPRLKIAALEEIAQRLNVDLERVRVIVGISARTWDRRRSEGLLSAEESDRLLRVARIIRQAIEVFDDADKVREWLVRPNRALERHAPIDLLGTDTGAAAVSDELLRIDYGDMY